MIICESHARQKKGQSKTLCAQNHEKKIHRTKKTVRQNHDGEKYLKGIEPSFPSTHEFFVPIQN